MKVFKYVFLFFAIIMSDQFTKQLAMQFCAERKELLSIVACETTFNKGVSFGLFANLDNTYHIVLLCLIVILLIILSLQIARRIQCNQAPWTEVVIFSGAIGNLIDRIFYGQVVDFISLHYKQFYFPIFNMADVCIVVGVCILIFQEIYVAKPCRVS